MYYEGSTSNNHEITEEEEGSTSKNHEITEEEDNISQAQRSVLQAQQQQFESNNPVTALPLKETGAVTSLSNESGGNINHEDDVTLFVAYDGEWEYDNKEWFFENSKGSTMDIKKSITVSEIIDKLCKQFKVNKELYRLKLEVHYKTTGSPWFPVTEIQNDKDLSLFISKASKTILPLCVSRSLARDAQAEVDEKRRKDYVTVFIAYDGVWEYDEREWSFKNFKSSKILVPKNITVSEITNILYEHLNVDKKLHRLVLEVSDATGWRRVFYNAQSNHDLRMFISETSKTKRPLCVTRKYNEISFGVAEERRKDVAYQLINDYPTMTTQVYDDITPLQRIIRKPGLFYSGAYYNVYQRFIYRNVPIKNYSWGSFNTADEENQETLKKDKFITKHARRCLYDVISRILLKFWQATLLHVPYVKDLKDDKVMHNTTIELLKRICVEVDRTNTSSEIQRLYCAPFCLAVENNTDEAIDVLTTYFPQLYASKKDGKNIFQLTVLNRSEMVYSYIVNNKRHAKSGFLISVDDDGNSIAHLAARLSPIHKIAYLPALQMQREFDWFREAKRVVGPAHRNALNKNGETPEMVFRKEHKKLRKDAEEWMKKTADSYTITAALIITITFAAAITVPGGNDDKTGIPIYEMKPSFITFAFAVATSMFTATASLLSFLYILTASYNSDVNFLFQLPTKLINGLALLSVSLISMMIAFSAALYIMFGHDKSLILILIGELAWLPIASFMTIQIPLLVEFISSTYCAGIFAKKKYYWESSANANKKKRT